jgi:hypothetical protein
MVGFDALANRQSSMTFLFLYFFNSSFIYLLPVYSDKYHVMFVTVKKL